jgi:CHASE1-domain containing sensor protein
VFQIGDIVTNTKAVMFNLHSEKNREIAIDNLISCVKKQKSPSQCASLTDFLDLVQFKGRNPAAILFYPVFSAKDASRLVGLTSVVFVWKVVNLISSEMVVVM